MHWPKRINRDKLSLFECKSWEFNFLKVAQHWLYLLHTLPSDYTVYTVHHAAHQGNKVVISKAWKPVSPNQKCVPAQSEPAGVSVPPTLKECNFYMNDHAARGLADRHIYFKIDTWWKIGWRNGFCTNNADYMGGLKDFCSYVQVSLDFDM